MNAETTYTVALAAESGSSRTEWIHLFPYGEFSARDGRGPWRITNPDQVIAASTAYANGRAIPVDYDHALVAAASAARTPAPAAGWINRLVSRDDGIWGLAEWTPKASAQLRAKEYRFISPVFRHSKDGDVSRLECAALTNQPALTQLTAICSMERSKVTPELEEFCGLLKPLLGLTGAAGPDEIVAALERVHTQASAASVAPPRDKFVPIEEFERVTAAFNLQNRGVTAAAAEMAVDRAIETGKLMPALKDWGVALCTENKPAFEAFVERTAGGVQHLFARTPGVRGAPPSGADMDEFDREVAARMGLSPEDYR